MAGCEGSNMSAFSYSFFVHHIRVLFPSLPQRQKTSWEECWMFLCCCCTTKHDILNFTHGFVFLVLYRSIEISVKHTCWGQSQCGWIKGIHFLFNWIVSKYTSNEGKMCFILTQLRAVVYMRATLSLISSSVYEYSNTSPASILNVTFCNSSKPIRWDLIKR
jgi:hypothetical protein